MATEEPVVATEPEVQPIAAEPKKKEPKPRKPRARKPSTHPPYFEMISDAITSLKERNGSSQQAIQKFIEQKHKELPASFRKLLLTNLKKSVADAKLVKVKASYKFPPARNSDKSPAKKKTTAPPKKKVNAGRRRRLVQLRRGKRRFRRRRRWRRRRGRLRRELRSRRRLEHR